MSDAIPSVIGPAPGRFSSLGLAKRKVVYFYTTFLALAVVWPSYAVAESQNCDAGASASLKAPLRPQETKMWCWAASGQMVMEYLGRKVAQCEQANYRFGRNDCCPSAGASVPRDCVIGGWAAYKHWGFSFRKTTDYALTWDELTAQLSSRTTAAPNGDTASTGCRATPFTFTWHWRGGGGHTMVAIGYKYANGAKWVEVNNPWPPDKGAHQFILYDEFVSGEDHTHWDDYYEIH